MIDLPDNSFGFALIPRTALRPTQSPYFATVLLTLGPYSSITFLVESGFTRDEPWVPAGHRFSIWYVIFSISQNSLIETAIGAQFQEDEGRIMWLATQLGYGKTEYLSGVFFDFEQFTRPVYHITNFSPNDIYVDFTVFGITEAVV